MNFVTPPPPLALFETVNEIRPATKSSLADALWCSEAANFPIDLPSAQHCARSPTSVSVKYYSLRVYYQTDRQTDILLTEKKSHYRLICHRNERDICTCIYKIVSLLKSYDNIHGMTYTAKIMLSGIAKIKTGYFDNINDYY